MFICQTYGLLVEIKPSFRRIVNEHYFRTCTSALGFDRAIG